MDFTALPIASTLGAVAALGACSAAAVAILDAGRRTASIPTWKYLQEDIARRWAERDQRKREVDELNAEILSLRAEQAQLEVVREQRKLEEERLADILRRLEELSEQRRELDDLRADLTRLLDQKAELDQQVLDLRGEQAERQRTVSDLQRQQEELAEKLMQAAARRESLETEVVHLTTQRESRQQELARASAALHALEQQKNEETSKLEDVRRRCEQLGQDEAALTARLSVLQTQCREAEDDITAKRAALSGLVEKHTHVERELTSLQETVASLEETHRRLRTEVEVERERVTELRHRRDALHGEIEMLKKVLASLEGKVRPKSEEDVRDVLGELLVPPEILVRAKRRLELPSEDKALERVRECLQQQGLQFSDRLLNAFHTSLKISDISPITVLAGISGTGKSELPRQYATAMGLPFLQLAVQPRWDSPQDLFGFYNYLEHRYKPTELARLMIHLDKTNWPDQASPYFDHMALVLLDEMNLARVEYYFSEFLSRLEVRRASDNAPAAEIELELGRLPGERRNRVYPVRRLLFVGTMNEDESTQTLSDKVVDRANVMRFPRPKQLAQVHTHMPTAVETDHYLPFSVWTAWVRRTPPQGRLAEWLIRINGYLEQLGRPFGHRMGQAITAYVANHPRSRQSIAEPMADQLEMRIFPKLRGVMPDESDNRQALDGLRAFIDTELRDDALTSAFDDACKRDLFVWRGVDRS